MRSAVACFGSEHSSQDIESRANNILKSIVDIIDNKNREQDGMKHLENTYQTNRRYSHVHANGGRGQNR